MISGPLSADEEIKRTWSIFQIGPDNPISLRAISPKGVQGLRPVNKVFLATTYPNVADRQAAFEAEALRHNALGYNVYIVMNPIEPEFFMGPVRDEDIECRRLLLVDIDRAGSTSDPASDTEVQAAINLAGKVEAHLDGEGWDDPIRVMSGNGVHLYYALDVHPNDDESKTRIQTLLRTLAGKFDNDVVCIDTSVFNASRITKVPGTIARKGVESGDRPYRMARVL